jgi:WXG100 family type VII secretion target
MIKEEDSTMASKFEAQALAMREAAKKLQTEATNYESATKAAMTAGRNLGAQWAGDARDAFVDEQTRAEGWYKKMTELLREYASTLNVAAQKYEDADAQAKSDIQKK